MRAVSTKPEMPPIEPPALKPAPLYLLRSFRPVEQTEHGIFCCLTAALTWRTVPRRVIARRYLGWLYRFPGQVLRQLLKHAAASKKRHGRGIGGQIADMAVLANRCGIQPEEYYEYGLGRFRGRPEMLRYISIPMFLAVAQSCIRRHLQAAQLTVDFYDKQAFEVHCRAHGFACAETALIADGGRLTDISGNPFGGWLPQVDLFVKPRCWGQGMAANRFDYVGCETFAAAGGERISGATLLKQIAKSSQAYGAAMLVQRLLVNSEEIAAMAGRTFATTRIVTLQNETGEPEVVFSCFRTAGDAHSVVDNYHANGVAFPLDVETGELGAGRRLDFAADPKFHARHPVTGARIEGARLPGWPEARALALALHRTYPGLLLAGWDIGLTPAGPAATEVNVPPGLPAVQMAEGFLGTRYSALLAHHALRYLEETESKNSRWRIGADR